MHLQAAAYVHRYLSLGQAAFQEASSSSQGTHAVLCKYVAKIVQAQVLKFNSVLVAYGGVIVMVIPVSRKLVKCQAFATSCCSIRYILLFRQHSLHVLKVSVNGICSMLMSLCVCMCV